MTNSMGRIDIVFADDHTVMQRGLRFLLENQAVAMAFTGPETGWWREGRIL